MINYSAGQKKLCQSLLASRVYVQSQAKDAPRSPQNYNTICAKFPRSTNIFVFLGEAAGALCLGDLDDINAADAIKPSRSRAHVYRVIHHLCRNILL